MVIWTGWVLEGLVCERGVSLRWPCREAIIPKSSCETDHNWFMGLMAGTITAAVVQITYP